MLLLYCLYSVPKTWEGHQAPTKRPVPPNGTSLLILTLPGCRSLVSADSYHPPYQTADFRGHLFSRISSTSSNHPSFLVYSGKCCLGAACPISSFVGSLESVSVFLGSWSLLLQNHVSVSGSLPQPLGRPHAWRRDVLPLILNISLANLSVHSGTLSH